MQETRVNVKAIVFPFLALALGGAFALGEQELEQLPVALAAAPVLIAIVVLVGTVLAALRHAEVIGLKIGEPYGTLVLTLSVTIIEVSLMASMIRHGADDPTEAREAVFSAIMIVCNGLVGLCLLLGGLRHREQEVHPMAASAYLAVLTALSVLTLVLPNYTNPNGSPAHTAVQVLSVSVLSALLYGAFLFMQTVRHQSYFLDAHAAALRHSLEKPSLTQTGVAIVGMAASLFGVALLARHVVPGLEDTLRWVGVEDINPVTGAALAMLVLLPESLNSLRAAAQNALQTALNGALGSVVATIGLTVPAVAIMSLAMDRPIIFGLDQRDTLLLALTLLLSVISFGSGRTNVLTGLVHLVVFSIYVVFLFVP